MAKPELISLLLPTRQRPEMLMRLYESAIDLADDPKNVEMVVYVDDDDESYGALVESPPPRTKFLQGPRKTISECWNDCHRASTGEIFMHCGDDLVFRTKGWDTVVRNLFANYPDKIVFAYGDDGSTESHNYEFGTHGFIHKNWTDVVGRFLPPYYESDYNDTHLNEIAKALNRHVHIPIFTEHMHFSLGKSEKDRNTEERLARHERQHPENVYNSQEKRIERLDEIERLRQFIENFKT